MISSVSYLPLEPTNEDFVTINCTVTDNVDVNSVTLYYRINGSSWLSISMTKESSIYSIALGNFSSNDFVEFYIFAVDTSLNEDTSAIYSFTVAKSKDKPTGSNTTTLIILGVGGVLAVTGIGTGTFIGFRRYKLKK